ncbi:MAG: hypothetical protein ACLFPX_01805 [Candidatus Omnitrophota bacterium]
MFFAKKNKELDQFAELLKKGIIALFHERGKIKFSDLDVKQHQIIEADGKMRANGIEKFPNTVTFVSAVNFYVSPEALEKKKTLGALIMYVPKDYLPMLMKKFQYPPVDDENEDAMLDSIGTLCNITAGRFKSEIKSAGYADLEMSHFINYKNNAVVGIPFCPAEYDYYQLIGSIEGEPRVILDMSMGVVPKR